MNVSPTVFRPDSANRSSIKSTHCWDRPFFSVGAVKGVEIGDGFEAAGSTGSRNNDPFHAADGRIEKLSNHSGGTLGG